MRSPIDREDIAIRPLLLSEGVPRSWWPPAPISEAQALELISRWRSFIMATLMGSAARRAECPEPGSEVE